MIENENESKYKFQALIIDDDAEMCETVESMLSTTPYFSKVLIAHDSLQAFQKINNQPFDLIILDNKMPKKDGTEIIEQINRKNFTKTPKIIFISGAFTADHLMIATQLGVRDILVKPFTRDKLIRQIEKVLKIPEEN